MATRILIVEDSDDVRESYIRWFQAANFEVMAARDAEQALEVTDETQPDVVLLDIGLPDIDGYTLAEKWHRDPKMSKVPLVALSGFSGDDHERRAQKAGCLIALPKPCMPDMILAAIRGALRA
jgi:DNA-binding response OmpR family regulator